MKTADKVIKEYLVTEKATELSATQNKYVFEVFRNVNRNEVKIAVEGLFDVKVKSVNILNKKGKSRRNRNMRGKSGRTAASKRAIVTLASDSRIELV